MKGGPHASGSLDNGIGILVATMVSVTEDSRAIAFEILPIKYSFSAAGGKANEDHPFIFRHEKTEKSRVFQSTGS